MSAFLARRGVRICNISARERGRKAMAKKLTIIAMMIAFMSGLGSSASALTITQSGVVGAYHGKLENSNATSEEALAQFLLDMFVSTSDSNGPAAGISPCNITADASCYATSNTEYAFDLGAGFQSDEDDFSVDAG